MNARDYSFEELIALVEEKAREEQPEAVKRAADVYKHLYKYANESREHFIALTLDGASRIIETRVISIGTLSQSLVHPREVFRPAIQDNAAGIIVAHNHPSGTLLPSRADNSVTNRLREAGQILGVDLLDHLIITPTGFYSYADEGLL